MANPEGQAWLILPKGVPGTLAVSLAAARGVVGYAEYEGWESGVKEVRLQSVIPVYLTTTMPLTPRTRGPGLLRLHGRASGFGGLFHQGREETRRLMLAPGTWTATVSWKDGRRSLSADFEVSGSTKRIQLELVEP